VAMINCRMFFLFFFDVVCEKNLVVKCHRVSAENRYV
jgi:hypothetical protein